MSLREDVAAVCVNTFLPRVTDALPYERLASWQKAPWLTLADECIRQMEWAYREGLDGDRELRPGHLTLAPPDWKP